MKITERYRCQACIHITKDEIYLMDCCTDGKGSVAALGNVTLCNSTAKSLNLPWVIFWRTVYVRMFKGENFCCSFHEFSLTANFLSLKMFLLRN